MQLEINRNRSPCKFRWQNPDVIGGWEGIKRLMSFSLAYSEMTADQPGQFFPFAMKANHRAKPPRHSTMVPGEIAFCTSNTTKPNAFTFNRGEIGIIHRLMTLSGSATFPPDNLRYIEKYTAYVFRSGDARNPGVLFSRRSYIFFYRREKPSSGRQRPLSPVWRAKLSTGRFVFSRLTGTLFAYLYAFTSLPLS